MSQKLFLFTAIILLFGGGYLLGTYRIDHTREVVASERSQVSFPSSQAEASSRYPRVLLAPKKLTGPAVVTGRKEIINEIGDTVYADFKLHPFPITQSTPSHSWTGGNLKGAAEIDELVHNDYERERLIEDNRFVKKRQLVYRKVLFRDLIEEHVAGGKKVESVILPGLDGAEYEVVIDDWEAEPASAEERTGAFSGHLKDDPESSVEWVYYEGAETGTIVSEALGLDLGYDPREEGQVVVNEYDRESIRAHEESLQAQQSDHKEYNELGVGIPATDFKAPLDK